jgi:hypothetical protein
MPLVAGRARALQFPEVDDVPIETETAKVRQDSPPEDGFVGATPEDGRRNNHPGRVPYILPGLPIIARCPWSGQWSGIGGWGRIELVGPMAWFRR